MINVYAECILNVETTSLIKSITKRYFHLLLVHYNVADALCGPDVLEFIYWNFTENMGEVLHYKI
ncbi:hypothetical protein CUMW_231350 [Citrus unshiu]|uniref:Uncharacterized protein n=1 Tax=Citrus unshiu TaxID=55188 RepID=A0A2H5QIU8_CITUN|nr:hypothetical protein CUMW_231350 [Citrus unshiu]